MRKNNVARWIITLIIFILASMLAACGGKKTSEPESESHALTKRTQKQTQKQTTVEAATEKETTTAAEDPEEDNSYDTWFSDYSIDVNLAYCTVTVYENYSDGSRAPINVMTCSCGREGHETPTGTFSTSDKYEWGWMADGSVAQYVTRFNGDILFHSVPSWSPEPGNIEIGEYNKLGGPASLGCIRLCVADASWIYWNMPWGTEVNVFYDWDSPGPWGKPATYKVPDDIYPLNQWDPTDPSWGNPWHDYSISISTGTITLPAGSSDDDLYSSLSVTDSLGNNVKGYAYIEFEGDYSTSGNYNAYVSVSLGNAYTEEYVPVVISQPEEKNE